MKETCCCKLSDGTACGQESTKVPVLRIWAPNKRGEPCRLILRMSVCEAHAAEATVENFVSPKGWDQVVASLVRLGRVVPDKRLTELEWIDLGNPVYQVLLKYQDRK